MAASRYIAPATLHALSKLQPWQTVIAVAFDWAAIVASVLAAECLRNPVVYVLAVLIVAGRMHGLGVLMHDFAHYRFIEGHRALSDWFCEIAISWPILASVHGYRRNHLAHHQHTNTDRDPDWTVKVGDRRFIFPREWGETATTLLSYVLIIGSARDLIELSRRFRVGVSSRGAVAARIGYYASIVALALLTGGWRLLIVYWLVPYFTVFFLLLYVRAIAEHGGLDHEHELRGTRSVTPLPFERTVFCPHNVNYHLEHHLYPSVPFYNLPLLRKALMANAAYAALAHVTNGYVLGLLKETVRSTPAT